MASLQKTYSGDLSTSIAKQLWIARNIAKAAKEDATDVAKAYGVDPMFRRGEFLSRALQMRATQNLPKRFQRQMPSVTMGDPSYLARGQSTPFASPVGPFKPTNAVVMAKLAGQPFPNIAVGAPLSSQKSAPVPNIPKVPGIPRTNNTAPRQKGTVVKDQQLGNFLAAVALSLSASLNSINKKLDESSEGISAAKDGIDNTYKKLEQHSDSLESKLDDIIDALRFSNRKEEEKRDKREAETKVEQQREEVDLSNSNRILMQDMDRQEVRDLQQENIEDQRRDDQAGDQIPDPWQEDTDELPSLAEGGIVSGPDSGYLAVLHGDEAVIPLDNNYTQNQPSAVGKQPISQMPMMAERGIAGDNPPSMKPSFTSNLNITNNASLGKKSSSSGMGEDLAKAIQLPMKAAGIVTMGMMGKVLQAATLPPNVVAHMKSITAPIAGAFGVSDVLSGGLSEQMSSDYQQSQERQDVLSAGRGKEGREKGVLTKIKEFLFGTGGGYRGTGGNTYINNRTSGTGGGTSIAWGNKKQKVINSKSDFGAIRRRTATTDAHMVEAGMLDPSVFETKYGISADKWLRLPDYPTDQSSLDSPVFTKNISYENAFDYTKFDSPQYGLKTSEIAYNMSMQDEVNNMIEGLSDPDSQVILNNHTAKTNTGKQVEYSAIAVRGNPLKEGTYLSPYSV